MRIVLVGSFKLNKGRRTAKTVVLGSIRIRRGKPAVWTVLLDIFRTSSGDLLASFAQKGASRLRAAKTNAVRVLPGGSRTQRVRELNVIYVRLANFRIRLVLESVMNALSGDFRAQRANPAALVAPKVSTRT